MNIETELKKEGIEVVSKLSTLEVNQIARNVANKLAKEYGKYGLNAMELFAKLSRLDMYKAKMPEGMSEANYFYKNTSIYFNQHIPDSELEEFAIHECIHYIQEVRDKKNCPIRMGLCNFTEFKLEGLGLNEAAVQLMASKAIGVEKEDVKYFGINFTSESPSYYPLECNLVKQMAYIVGNPSANNSTELTNNVGTMAQNIETNGEDILFESTINSNDNFKNKYIEATSEKTYYAIQRALDTIIREEESIIKLNNKIQSINDRNKKVDNLLKRIDNHKHNITVTFMRTQNLIVSSYFNKAFNQIVNLEQLENYRRKLQKYVNLIGLADGYTFFNDYYIEKMAQLEHKYNIIENGGTETAIEKIKTNKLTAIIKAIKAILFGKGVEEIDN